MDAGFSKVNEDTEALARMTVEGFKNTAVDINQLQQGQEDILLRMDYVANKFEVKKLERRVKRLEDKIGIKHSVKS